jgi:hypothetical protein
MSDNMPGLNLADIAPKYENVPIGDQGSLKVHGISAKAGLTIFQRFPKILGMVGEGFNLGAFLTVAPDAVAAIIAAAANDVKSNVDNYDADAETAAGNLPLEVQFDILEAVGRLTFTKGFAPFVQRMTALADAANSASFTRVPDMKSPSPSSFSSAPDTPQA